MLQIHQHHWRSFTAAWKHTTMRDFEQAAYRFSRHQNGSSTSKQDTVWHSGCSWAPVFLANIYVNCPRDLSSLQTPTSYLCCTTDCSVTQIMYASNAPSRWCTSPSRHCFIIRPLSRVFLENQTHRADPVCLSPMRSTPAWPCCLSATLESSPGLPTVTMCGQWGWKSSVQSWKQVPTGLAILALTYKWSIFLRCCSQPSAAKCFMLPVFIWCWSSKTFSAQSKFLLEGSLGKHLQRQNSFTVSNSSSLLPGHACPMFICTCLAAATDNNSQHRLGPQKYRAEIKDFRLERQV